MRRRAAALALGAMAALALVTACGEEEILLAKLPDAEDAGPSVEARRCIDDEECAGQAFCARSRCGEIGGICTARPVVCSEDPEPVCGCDGITYWNDCLRRAAGITAGRPGECELDVARACGGDPHGPGPGPMPGTGPCPPGASCARLLPPPPPGTPLTCPPDVPGTCWALPAVCPLRSGGDRWVSCRAPEGECTTTCAAIQTGQPHRRANACR